MKRPNFFGIVLFNFHIPNGSYNFQLSKVGTNNYLLFQPKLRGQKIRNNLKKILVDVGFSEQKHVNEMFDYG